VFSGHVPDGVVGICATGWNHDVFHGVMDSGVSHEGTPS